MTSIAVLLKARLTSFATLIAFCSENWSLFWCKIADPRFILTLGCHNKAETFSSIWEAPFVFVRCEKLSSIRHPCFITHANWLRLRPTCVSRWTNSVRNRKSCETREESCASDELSMRLLKIDLNFIAASLNGNETVRAFAFISLLFQPSSVETEIGEIFETIAKLRPKSFASSVRPLNSSLCG